MLNENDLSQLSLDAILESVLLLAKEAGEKILARRSTRTDLAANAALPDDTKLWAALQQASGGAWAGCVYDSEKIAALLSSKAARR